MNPFSGLVIYDGNIPSVSGTNKFFLLNDQKIPYNKQNNQFLFSIQCRTDVSSLAILDLVDQILISLGGGMVTKHGDYDSSNENSDSSAALNQSGLSSALTYMEITSPKTVMDIAWSSIRVYLGSNKEKQRVVYVLMTSKGIPKDVQQQLMKDATYYGVSVVNQINSAVQSKLNTNSSATNFLTSVTRALNLDGSVDGSRQDTIEKRLTIEEILALPQSTFAEVNSMIMQLFCVSIFEEYLSSCFLGLFMDNKNEKWLQQYINNNISTCVIPSNGCIGNAIYNVVHASRDSRVNVPVLPTTGAAGAAINVEPVDNIFKAFDEDVRNDRDEGDQKVILKCNTDLCNAFDLAKGVPNSGISDNNAIVVDEYFGSSTTTSNKWYQRCNRNPPEVLKSIVDIGFVRDCQRSFAYDLRFTLGVVGEALDNYCSNVEKSCAKLMTTLKGIYQRSGVDKPIPPEPKALTDYALHLPTYVTVPNAPPATDLLSGISIVDASLEIASLLIYKARKHQMQTAQKFKHLLHTAAATCLKSSYVDESNKSQELLYMATHIEDILYGIYNQLQSWAKDEAMVRMDRKLLSIVDRVRAIESYKYLLIQTLQNRANSLLGTHLIAKADKDALSAFRDKFRFINEEEEPVLFESPVVINGRSGMLYVTCGHICFQSNYALLQETVVLVIMWKTVVSLQLGEDTVYVDSPVDTSASANSVSNVITVTDSSGKAVLMSLTGATPDYAARVFGLFNLLMQAKYYQLLEGGSVNMSIMDGYLSFDNVCHRLKNLVVTCLKTDINSRMNEVNHGSKVQKDSIALAIINYYEQGKSILIHPNEYGSDSDTMISGSDSHDISSLPSGTPPPVFRHSSFNALVSKGNSLPKGLETHTGSQSTDALLEWESEEVSTPVYILESSLPVPMLPQVVVPPTSPAPVAHIVNESTEKKPKLNNIQVYSSISTVSAYMN